MSAFEEGYTRTMKLAGLMNRLRRAPSSLMGLPASRRAMDRAGIDRALAHRSAQDAVQGWRKNRKPLTPEERDKLLQGFELSTTAREVHPHRELVNTLRDASAKDEHWTGVRNQYHEQLKDVGTAGVVASPVAGAGLMYAANNED